MKIVASVCAGITLVASIVAVSSRLELQHELEVNAALRKRPTQSPRSVTLPATPTPDITLPATMAAVAPPEEPVSRTEPSTPAPAMTTLMNGQCIMENMFEGERQRLKDPEHRKLTREQVRATMEGNYPGLARELGLSELEADKLLDLLADHQVEFMANGSSLGLLVSGPSDKLEALRTQRENQQMQLEENIQALLGSKYAQWQAYKGNLRTRSLTMMNTQVTQVSTQLAQAGKPLTEAQNRALTTALNAELQRQTQALQNLPVSPKSQAQREEENNRRILDAIAPHVDADQLAVLREQMERRMQIERAERERLQTLLPR